MNKRTLTVHELDAQTAVELPDREMMALIVISNVLSGNTVTIDIRNVDVAVQVCAQVLNNLPNLDCTVTQ